MEVMPLGTRDLSASGLLFVALELLLLLEDWGGRF